MADALQKRLDRLQAEYTQLEIECRAEMARWICSKKVLGIVPDDAETRLADYKARTIRLRKLLHTLAEQLKRQQAGITFLEVVIPDDLETLNDYDN